MKILMMTNTYFPIVGGVERSISSFSDEFRKRGHEVLIAAPTSDGRAPDEEHVIRVPAMRNFNKTEFSVNLPVPGFIHKLMNVFSPDIVHSHHPFFMGDYALRLSRQYRLPLVFTYHTMFEKYVHYLPLHNEKARRFVIEIARGYANLTQQVIAPSQSVREILLERGVTVPVAVVPTGIDPERFAQGGREAFRRQHGIPPDAPVIGHVGRLAPEKNPEFLVRCLIELLREELRVHVLMIGRGPSEQMIRGAFEQAGLGPRLHLTGFLYNQDLVDAYFAMDVFAFTSLSETQGVVLLEAMAAGVPVVAVDSPGVRDTVKDFFNGRLVDECDQEKFVAALKGLLNCPVEESRKIARQAQETAREYSLGSCAGRILGIYGNLLEKGFAVPEGADSSWHMFTERIKAEWDMFKNLVEASEAAVRERSAREEERVEP